jgi:hypothetical protein
MSELDGVSRFSIFTFSDDADASMGASPEVGAIFVKTSVPREELF